MCVPTVSCQCIVQERGSLPADVVNIGRTSDLACLIALWRVIQATSMHWRYRLTMYTTRGITRVNEYEWRPQMISVLVRSLAAQADPINLPVECADAWRPTEYKHDRVNIWSFRTALQSATVFSDFKLFQESTGREHRQNPGTTSWTQSPHMF